MECQSCNTKIDYRFLSNCAECGYEIETTDLPAIPDVPLIGPAQKNHSWIRNGVNLAYVLVNSAAGMISGAVVVYFGAALIYISMYRGIQENPSVSCARGQAIGLLSILVGGFLGTMIGSAFAVKRPLWKTPAH